MQTESIFFYFEEQKLKLKCNYVQATEVLYLVWTQHFLSHIAVSAAELSHGIKINRYPWKWLYCT